MAVHSTNGDIHCLVNRPGPYPYTTVYKGSPEQIEKIRNLPNLLKISDQAKVMLNRIIASLGCVENIDNENHLCADNLLYELTAIVPGIDDSITLTMQTLGYSQADIEKHIATKHEVIDIYLKEMLSGECSVGRAFRLYEMLFALPKFSTLN